MKKIIFIAVFILLWTTTNALAAGSPIGKWKTVDDKTKKEVSVMEIYEKDGVINGKILQLLQEKDGGKGRLCAKCTGADKDKPIVGLVIMKGLKADGNQYSGGTIMDPGNGKVYKCIIEVVEGGQKLKVRGYIGTPLLGRNQFWLRAQ